MPLSAYNFERVQEGVRFTTKPAPIPAWLWPLLLLIAVLGLILFFIPTILAVVAAIALPLTWPKPQTFIVEPTGIRTASGFIPRERINSINVGNRHEEGAVSHVSVFGGGSGLAGAGMAIGVSAIGGLHNAASSIGQTAATRRGYFVAAQHGGATNTLGGGLEQNVAVGLANDVIRVLRGEL